MDIASHIEEIRGELASGISLVAVSKTKSDEEILEAYRAGQRIFGENRVQELAAKAARLPKDISWHLIGHLQSNKVKFIAAFVGMIQSVDSLKLLSVINKEALDNKRIIPCLLQFHIAKEESKFGLNLAEARKLIESVEFRSMVNVSLRGVMGIATFSNDENLVRNEFRELKLIYNTLKMDYFFEKEEFSVISMGMSGDYKWALQEGSNMVRIGSNIFGER